MHLIENNQKTEMRDSKLYCDKYLTHPTNELKPLPLPSLHGSFTPN